MLEFYFSRMSVESLFKDAKRLGMLPLRKWSAVTVKGKILQDMIDTIAVLLQRKSRIRNKELSETAIIGKLQSLICRCGSENISVDRPNRQVKSIFAGSGYKLPLTMSVSSVGKNLLLV